MVAWSWLQGLLSFWNVSFEEKKVLKWKMEKVESTEIVLIVWLASEKRLFALLHLKVEMKSISPLSNGSKDNPQADFDNPHLHWEETFLHFYIRNISLMIVIWKAKIEKFAKNVLTWKAFWSVTFYKCFSCSVVNQTCVSIRTKILILDTNILNNRY